MAQKWFCFGAALGLGILSTTRFADEPAVETIVMLRHGEKPAAGLGQLDCQGLNRALALPAVIKEFGRPSAIFVPDPSEQVKDHGQRYDYVRPLATIEPTAIAFGLPVNADLGVSDVKALQGRLDTAANRSALVLVAWEHHEIEKLARRLVSAHGGDPAVVPPWGSNRLRQFLYRPDHANGPKAFGLVRAALGRA